MCGHSCSCRQCSDEREGGGAVALARRMEQTSSQVAALNARLAPLVKSLHGQAGVCDCGGACPTCYGAHCDRLAAEVNSLVDEELEIECLLETRAQVKSLQRGLGADQPHDPEAADAWAALRDRRDALAARRTALLNDLCGQCPDHKLCRV